MRGVQGPVACSRERGQVLPFMVLGLFMAVACTLVVVQTGVLAADRARAQTAADAAALAGVQAGELEARAVAEANGAMLEVFSEELGFVYVEVRVGRASAAARATRFGHDSDQWP